jgi:ABC-type Mn2+/Zn2+ transport system permease subunit
VGLNANLLHYTLMALISLTVVASMQSVGVVLTIALMIIPGATAYLVTDRFVAMIRVAMALGVFSSIAGLYLSYYLDLPSGPAIVLVSAFILLAVIFLGPIFGKLPWGVVYNKIRDLVVLKSEDTTKTLVSPIERKDL